MKWVDIAEFKTWLKEKQINKSIKFIQLSMKAGNWLWYKKWTYVCSHQMSGGQKDYIKKNPDQHHKIDTKKTGCHCQVIIKYYLHTLTILKCYDKDHNYEIQLANIAYICLSHVAWDQIKVMLEQKVDQKEIVCNMISIFSNAIDTSLGTLDP